MTTVQDLSKKSVKIHKLWCEFHRNLSLIDSIPSSIVDEITDPDDKVWRNLYKLRSDALPSLRKNFKEFDKLTEDFSKTTDGEKYLQYDIIINQTEDRIMIFTSYHLMK